MGISLDDMKKVYCIGPEHVPADGPIAVEIRAFDSEETPARPAKNGLPAMPAGWRHMVYFRGWDLPLRLNNAKIDALKVAGGSADTDDLIGQIVLLQTMPVMKFGQTEMDVIILGVRAKPGTKALNQHQAFGPAAIGPASSNKQLQAAKPKDTRPIGPISKVLDAKLKLVKSTPDMLLSWAKVNDQELYEAIHGKTMDDYPAWTLLNIKYYLDNKDAPAGLEGKSVVHDPESDAAPPAHEIDVPF